MRSRNIKPGFFLNEELADIEPPWGRLCFAGLWCMADREGRLEDRPRRIRAEVFPYDQKMPPIEKILDELAKNNFIIRYEKNRAKFIQINKFNEHQRPHATERLSLIPAPLINGELTVNPPLDNVGKPPDSLIPDSSNTPPTPPNGGNGCEGGFLEWWKELPAQMRKDQEEALRVWRRKKRRGKLPDLPAMLQTLRAQKRSERWQREEGRYIPLPAHYLEKGGYHDESVEVREPPGPCPKCSGSGYRRAQPGEDGVIGGRKVCECKSAQEARGP